MCLIICAHQYHSKFPLVVTANRDEFFRRPTLAADFQQKSEASIPILAGKDLTQGGTWLGISQNGRYAAVTNVRNGSQLAPAELSRGFLTSDYLHSVIPPEKYLESLLPSLDLFAGFNLLVGDQNDLLYLNNLDAEILKLEPGIYGLSNGKLDSPWPKVERGKAILKDLLEQDIEIDTGSLIDIMTDKATAPDNTLPDTGVPIELERLLSASFIRNPQREYGTRCTTAIVANDNGSVRFCEQNYQEDASITSRNFFEFSML